MLFYMPCLSQLAETPLISYLLIVCHLPNDILQKTSTRSGMPHGRTNLNEIFCSITISSPGLHSMETPLRWRWTQPYTTWNWWVMHESNGPSWNVSYGFIIDSLQDELRSIMTVHLWIKMTWQDDKLRWNANEYGGLVILHLADHEIWQPDVFPYNRWVSSYGWDMQITQVNFYLCFAFTNIVCQIHSSYCRAASSSCYFLIEMRNNQY